MGKNRYVTDIIGDSYKDWRPGERILLSASTGCGKTTFVLKVLLQYAKAKNKHVVYFCNRRFLNFQFQANVQKELLNGTDMELSEYLHVRTYQHTECVLDYPNIYALDEEGQVNKYYYEVAKNDILYYIFDEAHYFCTDAMFNSETHYWVDKWRDMSESKAVTVFLTATPEPLLLYFEAVGAGVDNFSEYCMRFLAMHYVNKDIYAERWVCYLSPEYRDISKRRYMYYEDIAAINAQRQFVYNRVLEEWKDEKDYCYKFVKKAYSKGRHIIHRCYKDCRSAEEKYSYIQEHYFDELNSLVPFISQSVTRGEKWLIFVRTIEEGKILKQALKEVNCTATMITAEIAQRYDGKPAQRKSKLRKTFDELVFHEHLDCEILISTSVLDNGITLHSKNVKNIAICQPNKTGFLQMLGRIRAREDDQVDLYIQSFTPNQIKGYIAEYWKKIVFISEYWMKDKKVLKSEFEWDDTDSTGFSYATELFLTNNDWPVYELKKHPSWIQFLYYDEDKRLFSDDEKNRKLQANPLAIAYLMGLVYHMEAELADRDKNDPFYYLKEQLSWIGKRYNPQRWIDHDERLKKLHKYLQSLDEDGCLDEASQKEFRKKCFLLISGLRNVPEEFLKIKSRYSIEKGKYPGKKVLNQMLLLAGIPYQIVSKQPKCPIYSDCGNVIGVDQKTYWVIQKQAGQR